MTPVITASPITSAQMLTVIVVVLCVALFAVVAWLESIDIEEEEDE